jgi:hypothetical protein
VCLVADAAVMLMRGWLFFLSRVVTGFVHILCVWPRILSSEGKRLLQLRGCRCWRTILTVSTLSDATAFEQNVSLWAGLFASQDC